MYVCTPSMLKRGRLWVFRASCWWHDWNCWHTGSYICTIRLIIHTYNYDLYVHVYIWVRVLHIQHVFFYKFVFVLRKSRKKSPLFSLLAKNFCVWHWQQNIPKPSPYHHHITTTTTAPACQQLHIIYIHHLSHQPLLITDRAHTKCKLFSSKCRSDDPQYGN